MIQCNVQHTFENDIVYSLLLHKSPQYIRIIQYSGYVFQLELKILFGNESYIQVDL